MFIDNQQMFLKESQSLLVSNGTMLEFRSSEPDFVLHLIYTDLSEKFDVDNLSTGNVSDIKLLILSPKRYEISTMNITLSAGGNMFYTFSIFITNRIGPGKPFHNM